MNSLSAIPTIDALLLILAAGFIAFLVAPLMYHDNDD